MYSMKKIVKSIISYKERNFSSWLEFILTLGTLPFNEGGFLITLYFWFGGIAMVAMYFMLKYQFG